MTAQRSTLIRMNDMILNRRIRPVVFVIFLGLAAYAGGVVSSYLEDEIGIVVAQNQSGKQISSLSLWVCDQSLDLGSLAPGAIAGSTYTVSCESHYTVRAVFSSGEILTEEMGYVTGGLDIFDLFVIRESELDMGPMPTRVRSLPDRSVQ